MPRQRPIRLFATLIWPSIKPCRSTKWTNRGVLSNEHAVSIAIEAIASVHSVLVSRKDLLNTRKCAHQSQQRRFGQVEIGQQRIHNAKRKSRNDKEPGFGFSAQEWRR